MEKRGSWDRYSPPLIAAAGSKGSEAFRVAEEEDDVFARSE